jgi:energy-coupling factor transport system ATP-binding protein
MENEKCISLNNVYFRHNKDHPWVIHNLSISIYKGEWVSIIGPNGSGKSTLAKLINGLHIATEGTVQVLGETLKNYDSVISIRKDVGMVFQNPENQFIGATVEDDVAFGLENAGVERNEMVNRVSQSLKRVNMVPYKHVEPHRLSGGQKQRVAIAGILAMSPKVIILDEASSMLDPKGRDELMETLKALHKEGMTIISVTHDVDEMIQSERAILLEQGKLIYDGKMNELFNKNHECIELPFVTKLRNKLTSMGLPLKDNHTSYKDLINELWTLK